MKTHLNFMQKQAIHEKLKTVCFATTEGLCDYVPGWNDEGVAIWARESGMPGVADHHVAFLRREVLGRLYVKTGKRGVAGATALDAATEARISAIESSIAELHTKADETLKRVIALEDRAANMLRVA
jgi:hypothetical protein